MSSQNHPAWQETNTYRGLWWPRGSEHSKLQGTLEFVNRGPRLTFVSPVNEQSHRPLSAATVVHGELESGEKVTLWDLSNSFLESLGLDDEVMMRHAKSFAYALYGEHLKSAEDELFRYSAYGMHGLGTWSAMETPIPIGLAKELLPQYDPVEISITDRDGGGIQYNVRVFIENPRRLESEEAFPGGVVHNYPGDEAQMVFECTPSAPARVHDMFLFDLQALLTFSYQSGAPLQREWLAIENRQHELDVMRADPFTGQRTKGHLFKRAMVLTLESAEPAVLLPAWWDVLERLYPAPQVIYLYHHGPRGVLESSVASVIAVAEHIHGMIGPTLTRFEPGFLEGKIPAIKKAFPGKSNASFRGFLYEALKNDRPKLSIRLQELVTTVTKRRFNLLGVDPDQWTGDVTSVRNLLAHTSSHVHRRDSAASSILWRVNSQTRAIVTLLILEIMGIDQSGLDRAAKALNRELQQFLNDSHTGESKTNYVPNTVSEPELLKSSDMRDNRGRQQRRDQEWGAPI